MNINSTLVPILVVINNIVFVLFLFNNYVILKALPTTVLKDHTIGKEGYHGGNVCKMDYVIVESSLKT